MDHEDSQEMITNLDRGRLRAEAMEVKEMEEESIVEFYLLAKAMGLSVKELEEAVVWLGARFRGEQ